MNVPGPKVNTSKTKVKLAEMKPAKDKAHAAIDKAASTAEFAEL